MSFLSYLPLIIPLVIMVVQILTTLFPNRSRRILTLLGNRTTQFFRFLFQAKHIVNFLSILFGSLIIITTFSNNVLYTAANHDNTVFGAQPICKNNFCRFPIIAGSYAFFNSKLKYFSVTTIEMEYLSDSDQTITVGVGNGLIGYNEFEYNLPRTDGDFEKITLINNREDSQLCPSCFTGFLQKLGGSFSKDIYIKIAPLNDIQVKNLATTSIGVFSIYRVIIIVLGVLYILLGIVALKRLE